MRQPMRLTQQLRQQKFRQCHLSRSLFSLHFSRFYTPSILASLLSFEARDSTYPANFRSIFLPKSDQLPLPEIKYRAKAEEPTSQLLSSQRNLRQPRTLSPPMLWKMEQTVHWHNVSRPSKSNGTSSEDNSLRPKLN